MINKKNLWFLTLFSLVLVLSIYYVTMPSELLVTNNSNKNPSKEVANNGSDLEESDILTALRVESDYQLIEEMESLRQTLTDLNVGVKEKNTAFEELKKLNLIKGKEETIEKKIQSTYNIKSFVKIDGDQVRVVIASTTHSNELANNIMRTVQEEFENKMYISVKFQG